MNRKPVCGDCACQYTFFLSQGTFRPSDSVEVEKNVGPANV